ncbi:MAG: TIGR03619 family F420-dependent LLM class oxidoreductase [Acidimicrobiia bacterium]
MGLTGCAVGVSLSVPPPQPLVSVDFAFFASEAERLGFDSVWTGEHVTSPVECSSDSPVFPGGQVPGFFDPFVCLARASAVTSRVRLGVAVALVPEHHPVRLAKTVASLDVLSGGRVLLGVGVGWNREQRSIMGGSSDRPWAQTREAVLAMKAMWTDEVAEFHGSFYDIPPVRSLPHPTQRPHPPVLLGGISSRVIERIAEWGDGCVSHRTTPDDLRERVARLRTLAETAGRDPDGFDISIALWNPSRELVASYAAAGATRVVVHTRDLAEPADTTAALERIAADLL